MGDLLLGSEGGVPFVRALLPTLRASLSGHELHGSASRR